MEGAGDGAHQVGLPLLLGFRAQGLGFRGQGLAVQSQSHLHFAAACFVVSGMLGTATLASACA